MATRYSNLYYVRFHWFLVDGPIIQSAVYVATSDFKAAEDIIVAAYPRAYVAVEDISLVQKKVIVP